MKTTWFRCWWHSLPSRTLNDSKIPICNSLAGLRHGRHKTDRKKRGRLSRAHLSWLGKDTNSPSSVIFALEVEYPVRTWHIYPTVSPLWDLWPKYRLFELNAHRRNPYPYTLYYTIPCYVTAGRKPVFVFGRDSSFELLLNRRLGCASFWVYMARVPSLSKRTSKLNLLWDMYQTEARSVVEKERQCGITEITTCSLVGIFWYFVLVERCRGCDRLL